MATYRRVYDSRHLQADCQEPGSAPESYPRYLYLLLYNRQWRRLISQFCLAREMRKIKGINGLQYTVALAHAILHPNGISIGSAVFAAHSPDHRLTDHATSVGWGRV